MTAPLVLPIPPPTVSESQRFPRVIPRYDVGDGMYQYIGPRPWRFKVEGERHEIPPGFCFDGASVPSVIGLTWAVTYTPGSTHVLWAAMEHDWLCSTRPKRTTSRQAADRFLQVLGYARAAPWKANAMHRAVLLGGPRW